MNRAAMARRDFLFGAFKQTASEVAAPANADISAPTPIFTLGRIAEFPIGCERRFASGAYVLESFPEGLRAKSGHLPRRYYAISADAFGQLRLHPHDYWPENQVFSALTNEPTTFNPISEE